MNLGGVYYNCIQRWDEVHAYDILRRREKLPVEVLHPTPADTLHAPRLEGLYRVAYGDTFAAISAVELNAPVATGDPDFIELRDARLIELSWFGK